MTISSDDVSDGSPRTGAESGTDGSATASDASTPDSRRPRGTGSARSPVDPGETSAALMGFAASVLQGVATLLGPVLEGLPGAEVHPLEPDRTAEAIVFEPLRVLKPRVARTARRFFGRFGIVLMLAAAVLLLPVPDGLTDEGHRAIAVFVFTGAILALEPVSLPIAALLVPVAVVALGTGSIDEALAPFASPTVFLVLASLFLAEALRKHGLTRRIALLTTVASGGGINRLLLGIMGVAAFFSMWVENTATAAILIPVAMTIASRVPDPKKARGVLVLLVFGIAYAASIGGMATIMGSSSNAVASDFLNGALGSWTFFDWMKYGLPSMLLIFPITWLLLTRLVRVEVDVIDIEPARRDLDGLGGLSAVEKTIVWVLAVAIVFWVTGAWIEGALGLPETLMSSAVVAIVAVGALSVRGVIEWEDVKGVSWGIFFIIGAGLSLGQTLVRTGATDWFATLLEPVVVGPPMIVTILVLCYVSALLTNLLNNTTIAAVFVPILISIAAGAPGINPVQLVMPVTLATTFGYSLPSASGRMALVAGTGIVSRSEMMRYGLVATMISTGVLALFFYVLAVLGWI